jgi:hypothetical protein
MARRGYPRRRIDTFHEQTPRSKNVWNLVAGERGLAMSVSSEARLGRERAAPKSVRGMGGRIVSSLGRCGGLRGSRWAAAGDHRGDQGIVRHGNRRGHSRSSRRARHPGALPPGHLRTHRRMKETVETINGTRSRNGEKSRRVFATCRSAWRVLHPACRGHAEHSPQPVPAVRSWGG